MSEQTSGSRTSGSRSTEKPAPAKSVAVEATASEAGPAVLVVEKREKKRKKKYSKGLRDVQRLERGVSKATWRLADAVGEGVRKYNKRANKSARKRRDGALRDAMENVSIATGKALEISSKAPRDLTRGLNTKSVWKQARPAFQVIAMPFFSR